MSTLAEQLHASATHKAGLDPACPVCQTLKLPGIGREQALIQLRHALSRRTKSKFSVTGGSGTAWGWIGISLRPSDYDKLTPDQQKAKLRELNELFDRQGASSISVPASSEHYREYIRRALGEKNVPATPAYWD
jgi:hypothetical protein